MNVFSRPRSRRMRFALFASVSVAAAALFLAHTSDANAESLSVALSRLNDDHPLVRSALENIKVAKEGINQAEAGYYPTISVTGSYGFQNVSNPTTRSAAISGTRESVSSSLANKSADITLSQNLFNGFNTLHTVRSQEILEEVSHFTLEAARQAVFLEGATAYLNVLRASVLVQEALSNVTNFSEQFQAEKRREEEGAGLSVDRVTAEQRLLVAQGQLILFESQFQEAEATFEQVFGYRPDLQNMEMPPSQRATIPAQIEEALLIGIKENPQLRAIGRSVDGIGELKSAARSGYMPSIDLSATALMEDDADTTIGIKRERSVTLTATWDIFNGFLTKAQVATAAYQQASIREQETDLNRRTREFVERFWHQFKASETRVDVLRNAVSAAKDMVTLRQEQLDSGDGRRLDVLDAQSAVHSANIELTNAQTDGLIAQFGLLQAMGRLNLDFIHFDS